MNRRHGRKRRALVRGLITGTTVLLAALVGLVNVVPSHVSLRAQALSLAERGHDTRTDFGWFKVVGLLGVTQELTYHCSP